MKEVCEAFDLRAPVEPHILFVSAHSVHLASWQASSQKPAADIGLGVLQAS